MSVVPSTLSNSPPPGGPPSGQYSVATVLAIWIAAAAPMGALAWIVWPALSAATELHPGLLFWVLMVVGMVWQFALALIILHRELGTLRWSAVAPRIWAQQPRSPRTGRRSPRSWWALVPITAVFAGLTVASEELTAVFDAVAWMAPEGADIRQLVSPQFEGQWWILGIAAVSFAFNYVLGEELLFRGVLLPKMQGALGRWDWLANALLFAAYHLHRVWALPLILLTSLPFSWAARRYRTIWFAIILHAIEGVVVLVVIVGVVSGVAFA